MELDRLREKRGGGRGKKIINKIYFLIHIFSTWQKESPNFIFLNKIIKDILHI